MRRKGDAGRGVEDQWNDPGSSALPPQGQRITGRDPGAATLVGGVPLNRLEDGAPINQLSAGLAITPADPTNVDAAELSAEKLTVRFQGLAAISDVSLTVRRHEVFGLIGPNGAGKTTLVNCLTGFQVPTEGRVLVGRQSTTGWEPTRFREMGSPAHFRQDGCSRKCRCSKTPRSRRSGWGSVAARPSRTHTQFSTGWDLPTRWLCLRGRWPIPTSAGSASRERWFSPRLLCCSMSQPPACRTPNARD